MGFSLSPTVTVREFDKTLTVPGLATSIAAAVGHFQWGPVEEIRLVDSEAKFIDVFGEPDDDHYEDWFPSTNFLAYSNNLKQVRVVRHVEEAFDDLTFTQAGGTVTTVAGDFPTNFAVGDQLVISGSANNDGVYEIENVTTTTLTVVGDFNSDEGTADVSATFNAGAFNARVEVDSIPNNGTPIFETTVVQNAPRLIKNRDDLDEIAAHTPLTAFYARCPGKYGNLLKVSCINGAWAEETSPDNWNNWAYKNFFDFAPTGNEIYVVVELDDTIVEVFSGSQDSTSVSPLGGTDYFVELINRTSDYLFAVPPVAGSGLSHQHDGASTLPYSGTLQAGFSITPVNFTATMTLGADSAPRVADYARGFDLYADPEAEDVNFLLQGGAGTQVGKYILENIADTRLDCVACMSPNFSDVVGDPTPALTIQALRDPGGDLSTSSSYGVIDGNYKQQYDKYNDVYRWVAFNGDMAGLMARTDDTRDPWWSPAGLNRGILKNVFKVAFNPTKAQRDELYRVGINPIAQFRGEGTVLYGDKTAQTKPSAFDRINVRRLFITIEKAIATASRYQLFEFNDEVTRNNFLNLVEPYLRNVQGRRGITEFLVVCDETNNTGEVIDRNEFVADIYIKPARSINFIQLNFVAVKTGVQFEEVLLTNTN